MAHPRPTLYTKERAFKIPLLQALQGLDLTDEQIATAIYFNLSVNLRVRSIESTLKNLGSAYESTGATTAYDIEYWDIPLVVYEGNQYTFREPGPLQTSLWVKYATALYDIFAYNLPADNAVWLNRLGIIQSHYKNILVPTLHLALFEIEPYVPVQS